MMDKQLRNLRRRQVDDAFRTQSKRGAYWSIGGILLDRNDVEYEFDKEKALKLAELPTRFAKLDEITKKDLVNLGYAMCDSAMILYKVAGVWHFPSALHSDETSYGPLCVPRTLSELMT